MLEIFRGNPLFKEIADEEIESFASVFSERRIGDGMTVFMEKMPGESLFLIRKGFVRISRMIAEGEEKILLTLGPGDIFGEMALFDTTPRSATARAMGEVQLLCLKKSDFETFCDQDPKIGLKFMRNVIRIFTLRVRENEDNYQQMLKWATSDKT
jgi:CRP/FNR family transcriptional regulator, cyclic AMP receptor protein